MQSQLVRIADIKPNPSNPRVIKDDKFKKLVQSILDFPEMLDLRPIVVNDDMVVLGGNMRLRACQEAGIKDVPIVKASNLTPEQQKEFIIKDNVGYGEWDWAMLSTDFEIEELKDWGLDVWQKQSEINLDEMFGEDTSTGIKKTNLVLEYTKEDYDRVIESFKNFQGTKEEIVFKLVVGE